jgi:hypothetical protein
VTAVSVDRDPQSLPNEMTEAAPEFSSRASEQRLKFAGYPIDRIGTPEISVPDLPLHCTWRVLDAFGSRYLFHFAADNLINIEVGHVDLRWHPIGTRFPIAGSHLAHPLTARYRPPHDEPGSARHSEDPCRIDQGRCGRQIANYHRSAGLGGA